MTQSHLLPTPPSGYRYERKLGRGGMGVVYLATQLETQQQVAIKVLNDPDLRSDQLLRFRREMQIPAQLAHPHIVGVKEASWENPPHIVLEYCSGGSLAARLRGEGSTVSLNRPTVSMERTRGQADDAAQMEARPPVLTPLPIIEAVQTMIKIAGALGALHDKGYLHRDIKPANILLDANGIPKLADFGLAKDTDDRDVTTDGDKPGTSAYMAPELLSLDETATAGWRTEVYALGATLYELLTGLRPFSGTSASEIRNKILEGRLKPPSELRPELSSYLNAIDLDTICLKCLAHEPDQRYVGASELAEDLEKWLANRPIRARRPSLGYRVRLFVRRNPWWTFASTVAVLLAVAYGTWWWMETSRTVAQVAKLREEAEVQIENREYHEAMILLREALALIGNRSWTATLRRDLQQQILGLEPKTVSAKKLERFNSSVLAIAKLRNDLAIEVTRGKADAKRSLRGEELRIAGEYERMLKPFRALTDGNWRNEVLWTLIPESDRQQLMMEIDQLQIEYSNLQLRGRLRSLQPAGFGVVLAQRDEPNQRVAYIDEVVKNGGAAAAGLRPGDRIIAVGDNLANAFDGAQAIASALIGAPKSKVELTVISNSRAQVEKLMVVRSSEGRVGIVPDQFIPLCIATIEPESQGAIAGLKPGDLLLYVNGEPAEGAISQDGKHYHFDAFALAFDRTAGPSVSLVFYRPQDQSLRVVEFPCRDEDRRVMRRLNAGIMARVMRTEVGAAVADLSSSPKPPPSADVLITMVVRQLKQDRRAKGDWPEDWVEQAWDLTRIDEMPHFRTGLFLQMKKDFPAAEQEWEVHLKDMPDDSDAMLNLLFCLYMLKRDSSIVEKTTRYIQRRPQDEFAYFYRGKAHETLGDPIAAEADYRRAVALNGDYQSAKDALSKLLATKAKSEPITPKPPAKP
ncbi:MAG: protein kinase domain-containing protein [Pirellulaceae bacterium]